MEEKEKLTLQTSTQETDNDVDIDLITTLPPQMQRFVHLYMTGQYPLSKLAELLGVHPNTVGKWIKRKDVQAVIQDLSEATHLMVANNLKVLTLKASNKLNALIDSPIDGVALQAVKDVLDRAGHKPKQEIKVDKTVTTIEQKMKELIDTTIIDADFEEVIEDGE